MATDAERMLLDRTLTYLRAGGDPSRLTLRQRQMIDGLGGPTPERISKANGSLQTYRLHRKNSRAAKEIAFRVGLPALRLYHQGQIGTAELRAANKFQPTWWQFPEAWHPAWSASTARTSTGRAVIPRSASRPTQLA